MPSPNTLHLSRTLLLTAALLASACGGGGGGGSAPAPAPAPASGQTPLPDLPASGTGFVVASDAGDPIGGGNKAYAYSQANARIRVSRTGALLQVEVLGDEVWEGRFTSAQGGAPLVVGEYLNLSDDPVAPGANGSQTWGPEPLLRNCQLPAGSLKITDVAYSGEQITRLSLEFEQRCGSATGSLRGRLRWDAADTTAPPGPTAVPAGLWQAPAGSVPASGNYIRLEGGTGVNMGSGPTLLYTPENALIGLSAAGRQLKFNLGGDVSWFGNFYAMSSRQRIEVGYYPLLLDHLRYNPAKGALGWMKLTESCLGTSRGWVAVDAATYAGDRLQMLEMCVYVLASRHYGTLYIGVTSDLPGRMWQHRNGALPGFTSRHQVQRLVHFEMFGDMERAILREKQLKNWHRSWKINLINAENPGWRDLAVGLGLPPLAPNPGRNGS